MVLRTDEDFTESTIFPKPLSSTMRTCFMQLSTMASGVGPPYLSRSSFSTEPEFTPMRMQAPFALAQSTTAST